MKLNLRHLRKAQVPIIVQQLAFKETWNDNCPLKDAVGCQILPCARYNLGGIYVYPISWIAEKEGYFLKLVQELFSDTFEPSTLYVESANINYLRPAFGNDIN